jgi:hypothetical protein
MLGVAKNCQKNWKTRFITVNQMLSITNEKSHSQPLALPKDLKKLGAALIKKIRRSKKLRTARLIGFIETLEVRGKYFTFLDISVADTL